MRQNLPTEQTGFWGFHRPFTHFAVVLTSRFKPYPLPQATRTIVPALNVMFGSLPCFTISTLTNGSVEMSSQGERFFIFTFSYETFIILYCIYVYSMIPFRIQFVVPSSALWRSAACFHYWFVVNSSSYFAVVALLLWFPF